MSGKHPTQEEIDEAYEDEILSDFPPEEARYYKEKAHRERRERSMTECCVDKSCTPETCMKLPDGRTCSECFHFNRCAYVFNKTALDNTCVYSPRGYEEEIDGVVVRLKEFVAWASEPHDGLSRGAATFASGLGVVVGDLVTWIEKIQQQRRDDNGK